MEVTIFGIHLNLNPIAFHIGNWPIYWYGIIIALGFTLAIIYGMKNAERFGVNTDKMLDVVIVTTPVAILCARIYYVLFDGEKVTSFGDFFGFGGGSGGFSGIAIYGAVVGAAVCGAIMCMIKKIKILNKCIENLNEIENLKECYTIKDLDIDGKVLINLGYKGKEVGDILEFLLDKVIKKPSINHKDILINLLKL